MRTNVSEQLIASIIKMERLVTAYVLPPSSMIPSNLMMEKMQSYETSVVKRDKLRHIQGDGFIYFSWCLYPHIFSIMRARKTQLAAKLLLFQFSKNEKRI
jgi:hypothetical protein